MNYCSIKKGLLLASAAFLMSLGLKAQKLAFPGAEGFGAYAAGGRGGEVYHVTTLKDTGPGSLRDALSKPNRTVVFDVSGTIKTGSRIVSSSNITIAGQTAPGQGISVYGHGISFSKQSNVIVRYIRFRGNINMSRGDCVLTADSADNLIFDHVSVEWGRWDNLHIKESTNITLQYCLIGEAIDPQRFGALLENPKRLSIHHSLWIDNHSRNPKAKADIEFINNVIYNWGTAGFVGGHSAADHHQDIINNYFIAGPNSSKNYLNLFAKTDYVYHSGNMTDMNKDGVLNGIAVADSVFTKVTATLVTLKQNEPPVPVKVQTAEAAYQTVVDQAGASLERDALDTRLISYLKSLGTEGKIFWTDTEAGGHPKIAELKAPADADADGMPDAWEKEHNLNPENAADAAVVAKKKQYSNLELYLNEMASRRSSVANPN